MQGSSFWGTCLSIPPIAFSEYESEVVSAQQQRNDVGRFGRLMNSPFCGQTYTENCGVWSVGITFHGPVSQNVVKGSGRIGGHATPGESSRQILSSTLKFKDISQALLRLQDMKPVQMPPLSRTHKKKKTVVAVYYYIEWANEWVTVWGCVCLVIAFLPNAIGLDGWPGGGGGDGQKKKGWKCKNSPLEE